MTVEVDNKKKIYCPMCGKSHVLKNVVFSAGKAECITICQCGHTSFMEIYIQSAFTEE